MVANFTYSFNGKEVSFKDTSLGLATSYSWDFGDSQTSTDKNPNNVYADYGFYSVKLTTTDAQGSSEITLPIGVSGKNYETPTMPLLAAFYAKFPADMDMVNLVKADVLTAVIRKWQKSIAIFTKPLVPSSDVYNELNWPTLYNDLVLELVIIDVFDTHIRNYLMLLVSKSNSSGGQGSGGSGNSQPLKAITTGPAVVEWHDISSTTADQLSSASKPGGLIDQVKAEACHLAGLLSIPLDFCDELEKPFIGFKIAKRRHKHYRF